MPRRSNGPSVAALVQNAVVESVFAALRPPDDPPGPPPAAPCRRAAQDLPRLTFEEVILRTDYQECIAVHLISRADLVRLLCTSRRIRAALLDNPEVAYLGLFRTAFGREFNCRLAPHQVRSLRHMLAAEDPPGWRFGELRGGILADDPGLGKTVTMLALMVRSAGCAPAVPAEFWGRA